MWGASSSESNCDVISEHIAHEVFGHPIPAELLATKALDVGLVCLPSPTYPCLFSCSTLYSSSPRVPDYCPEVAAGGCLGGEAGRDQGQQRGEGRA